jgi:hypothetical protein
MVGFTSIVVVVIGAEEESIPSAGFASIVLPHGAILEIGIGIGIRSDPSGSSRSPIPIAGARFPCFSSARISSVSAKRSIDCD